MKISRKIIKIIYFLFVFFLIAFIFFYPIIMNNKLINQDINMNSQNSHLKGGFIKIWHIDDFEGGSGNRANYLQKVAMQFEDKNKGWYVVVQSLSQQQAFNSIKNGEMPDLISFSHYSGFMLENVLKDYQGKINVRNDLLEYGKLKGIIKAVPWYLSGYCLIGNKKNEKINDTFSPSTMFSYDIDKKTHTPSLAVGLKNNSFAFLSTLKNRSQIGSPNNIIKDFENKSTFEVYNDFCNKDNASVLLGTARDYYRVKNKIDLGAMNECKFYPLGNFSDLVGYMGVCASSEYMIDKCTQFIEFLTSKEMQYNLSKIGLFSTTYQEIYKDNEHYYAFQKVLHRNLKSINIFMPKNEKELLWKHSINATFGNSDSLNYVKKYL